MMTFAGKTILGKTGLQVSRLGIASSFGAPTEAYEEAFERGCNYFTWGTFIKGTSAKLAPAIKNICANGKRQDLVLAVLSYAHQARLTEYFIRRHLKALGLNYIDVLILGYFNKRPSQRLIDGALKMKEKGMIRFLGLTSHKRSVFAELAKENIFDLLHVRYNAAHRGAEQDVFPHIKGEDKPGIVTFTATRWGKLLNAKKMPAGVNPPTAVDCYRFVLSHKSVDVCMMGAKTLDQMRENLQVLNREPMSAEELKRMQTIGDFIYSGKK